MARTKKDTIDYFPHPVKNGTRMFIMEQTYGDKGYVAYYKLLELLGAAEGHYLDFKEDKSRLFFSASIKANTELLDQIMLTLCEVGAIDKQLWIENQVVWCQDLVNSVSDLYRKRCREIPLRPYIRDGNTILTGNTGSDIPQSIVKDSKEKDSIVKDMEKLIFPFAFGERFLNLWLILIKEKKWRNKSSAALQSALNKLGEAPCEDDAIEMMNNTLTGNWQGIFELEKNKNGKRQQQSNYNNNKSDINELVTQTRRKLAEHQSNNNDRGN